MLEVGEWHTLISAAACAVHLAFALVLWLRRDRANIALPLALLFFDTFVWTFAELAFSWTHAAEWRLVDHAFSSWLPVLTVQVVAGFVGRSKALRSTLRALYGAGAMIAALAVSSFWAP